MHAGFVIVISNMFDVICDRKYTVTVQINWPLISRDYGEVYRGLFRDVRRETVMKDCRKP